MCARTRRRQSRRRLRIRPVALFPCPTRGPDDGRHLDQRGTHRRATPGDRRAAALLSRPRYRRGGVPGGLPARPRELAAQRSAARSDIVADPGRPQRRAGWGPAAQAAGSAAAGRDDLGPRRRGDAAGGTARRLTLPRRRAAPAVHLLPSGAAGHTADRAGAAHRLRSDRGADRPRVPGERGGDGAAHHPRQGADRARRCAVRNAGCRGARRTPRRRGGHDLPGVQRRLFRGQWIGARAAVRRGHPPGAPAAAAVPDRAGNHGPHRADAAAACAHRGALRCGGRNRPARRSGSRSCGMPS